MAEEQAATQDEQAEQQFVIERIYVKDVSFESPNSPDIFTQDWEPTTDLNLHTVVNPLGESHYEVELQVTVTVKDKSDKTAFLVEVTQAGAFMIQGYPDDQLNHLLSSFCPSQLFPYAREVISNLVSKGSFPEMHLSPINFDALYAQRLAEEEQSGDLSGVGEESNTDDETKH